MKDILLPAILLFVTSLANTLIAQTTYEAGMTQAFTYKSEGKEAEAIALLERIAQAEQTQWIPLYHAAHMLIAGSFEIDEKVIRDAQLEKARDHIKTAQERSPDNAELITLEGFLFTAYVAMEPETYGMMYSPKIVLLHQQALAIDPNNPRAKMHLVEFEWNRDRFFGKDLTPYCEAMQAIIPIFEAATAAEPFAPTHGIERAKRIATSCDG